MTYGVTWSGASMSLENRSAATYVGPALIVVLTISLAFMIKRSRSHRVDAPPQGNASSPSAFPEEGRTIHGEYGDFVISKPPANATPAELEKWQEEQKARLAEFNAKERERTFEEEAVRMAKADPDVQRMARFAASKEQADAVYQRRLAYYR